MFRSGPWGVGPLVVGAHVDRPWWLLGGGRCLRRTCSAAFAVRAPLPAPYTPRCCALPPLRKGSLHPRARHCSLPFSPLLCSLLGLIAFTAPYLPWALLGFSLLLGHDVTSDLLGIGVGHIYYFLADVFPALARVRGWRIQKILHTPWILHALFGTNRRAPPVEIVPPH